MDMSKGLALELRELNLGYGDTQVVKGLSVDVEPGGILTLLGASGCGKSTVLKAIAGIINPWGGTISIGERDVTHVRPARRNVGLVFQDHALFPHMNVADNVQYGLVARKVAKNDRAPRVREMLSLVRMEAFEQAYPHELSGGQAQRVALARALAISPACLLMDEPFSSLDARLREEMRAEVHELIREMGVTTVIVTHDREEALEMATKIAVMADGQVVEAADPLTLYSQPQFDFSAEFVAGANILRGEVRHVGGRIELAVGPHATAVAEGPARRQGDTAGTELAFAVRPRDVRVSAADQRDGPNVFSAVVLDIRYVGSDSVVMCRVPDMRGALITARLSVHEGNNVRPGDRVMISWNTSAVSVVLRWRADRLVAAEEASGIGAANSQEELAPG